MKQNRCQHQCIYVCPLDTTFKDVELLFGTKKPHCTVLMTSYSLTICLLVMNSSLTLLLEKPANVIYHFPVAMYGFSSTSQSRVIVATIQKVSMNQALSCVTYYHSSHE